MNQDQRLVDVEISNLETAYQELDLELCHLHNQLKDCSSGIEQLNYTLIIIERKWEAFRTLYYNFTKSDPVDSYSPHLYLFCHSVRTSIALTRNTITQQQRFAVQDSEVRDLKQVHPLKLLEYVLFYFVPKKDWDNVLGDLYDEFNEVYPKFGKAGANVIFARRVLAAIGPYTQARTGKRVAVWTAKLMVKLGLVAAVEEWFRKLIH